MTRWKPLSAIIAVAIVLLLLAAALFVRSAGRKTGANPPATSTKASPLRSTVPAPSGRERCMRKCAAQRLGYVYGAEQRAGSEAGPIVQPETCTCM